jgi:hypothetical protein
LSLGNVDLMEACLIHQDQPFAHQDLLMATSLTAATLADRVAPQTDHRILLAGI